MVLAATTFGVLFLGGRAAARLLARDCSSAARALGVLAFSSPYRLQRLIGFLDPWADPYGGGFQLTQSLIAIGRGEWLGVGLGASVQKLFYLPEAHTDFVFAVLAEELGFAGVVARDRAVRASSCIARSTLGREAIRSGMPFQALVAHRHRAHARLRRRSSTSA